jgi:hypothetical protein
MPLRIFLWACAALWLLGGTVSYFLGDREYGLLLLISFLILSGLVAVAAAVLWVLHWILALFHVKLKLPVDQGISFPKAALVLSSKTDTASLDLQSAPPATGRLSKVQALFMIAFLLGAIIGLFGYVWFSVGTKTFLMMMAPLLAVGLLAMFETGRTILKGLFVLLQMLMVLLDTLGSTGGGRGGGGFAFGGGGGFSGGGSSGKW